MNIEDIHELVLAIAVLVTAATPIALALIQLNRRVDRQHDDIVQMSGNLEQHKRSDTH